MYALALQPEYLPEIVSLLDCNEATEFALLTILFDPYPPRFRDELDQRMNVQRRACASIWPPALSVLSQSNCTSGWSIHQPHVYAALLHLNTSEKTKNNAKMK